MMGDIDRSFDWWSAALRGTRGPIDADNPKSGFYRWVWKKATGTEMGAVAIWYDSNGGELRYQVDGKDIDDTKARTRWPHDSRRPISEKTFWTFRDTGKWIDVDDAVQLPDDENEKPDIAIAKKIADLKASADKYAKIESDEIMVLAQSVRAELMEQSTKADKLRSAEKEPHLKAGREVDAKYQPMIKIADASALSIRRALESWNDFKLSQLEAARKAAEAAVVEDMDIAPQVISNAPMPSTQIRGGGGRAASVGIKLVVTSIDLDKAFKQFRDTPEVMTVLMSLAQKAIDSGLPCEAATVEKKSAIR